MNTFVTFLVVFFGVIFAVAGVWFYVWMFLMYVRMARDVHKISIGDIHDEVVVDENGDVVTDDDGNPKLKWLERIFTWSFYKNKKFWVKVTLCVAVVAVIIAGSVALTKHVAEEKAFKAKVEYYDKMMEDLNARDSLMYEDSLPSFDDYSYE